LPRAEQPEPASPEPRPSVAAESAPQQHIPEVRQPAPAADPAEIERALKDSGLELVQTRPGGASAEPIAETEFVPAKRERRPPPSDSSEPLVQVETHKSDDAPASN
jgi:ribonuclease E